MDLSVTRDTVRLSEPIFDSTAEHPIDCDIILPDYCPDIARIIKTEAVANIDTKSVDNGKLTLGGNLVVRIIYIPENTETVRCVTHEEAFNHAFDAKNMTPECFFKAKARMQFMNCRPVGPRRLQVKASVSISVKAWSGREEEFISGCEDGRLEMLKKPMKACSLVGMTERQYKVSDELEVGHGKPPVASIIKSDAVAVAQDCKVISNKIVVKGEVMIHTLYLSDSEDGALETLDSSIPFSQIVDMDGVDEDSVCNVRLLADNVKSEILNDSDGENRLITAELYVNAFASAYKSQEFNTVSDAYSTEYDTDLKTKQVTFENLIDMVKTNELIRDTVELQNGDIASILDCTANPVIVNVKFDGKTMIIAGNMELSMIAQDTAGGTTSIDKVMPFELREELSEGSEIMKSEPDITVFSVGYSLAGSDRVDMRIECGVEAAVFGVTNDTVVVDMDVDDTKEKECPCRKALTIYFGDKGERLWEIAKKYNTSMNAIMKENNLESDLLEDRSMLLIPKARCIKK